MSAPNALTSASPMIRRERWLLWLILALAAGFRLIALEASPPGANIDEAVHAYEAQCLLKTGKDHAGNPWPIFCHGCGPREQRSAPFIYLLIPIQALFGMSVWSTRLPPAVLGIVTVWLTYKLVQQWYGNRPGLLSALLLALSPWHIHLSRLGFEASICPFMLMLGLWLLSTAYPTGQTSTDVGTRGPCLWRIGLSGLTIGLLLWTYHSMRLFVPLLLAGGTLLYSRAALSRFRTRAAIVATGVFLSSFLVGVAPFLYAWMTVPEKAWGRAWGEFILNRIPNYTEAAMSAAQTYLLHFSPRFLVLEGDPSPIQAVPGFGQMHVICAILFVLGLVRVVCRWRIEPVGRLLLWWVLIAPLPPALTKLDAGHALRAVGMLPALQILAGIGLDWLLGITAKRSVAFSCSIAMLAGGLLLVGAARFAHQFFVIYPQATSAVFGAEWPLAFAEVRKRRGDYDLVLLTQEKSPHTGRLYLFWEKIPVAEYFATPHEYVTGWQGDVLTRLGPVVFANSSELPDYLRRLAPDRPSVRALVVERPGIPVPGEVVVRIEYPNGQDALVLYAVQANRR